MHLNLRQIEVFRAVMVTGSIIGAAKLLHVTPSALSRTIAYAEQRLGLKLFDRGPGRLLPTPEAKRLLAAATSIYEGVERFNSVADDLVENRTGHLRLASTPSLGQRLMPRAIAEYQRRFPNVSITLQTWMPEALIQAVVRQQVEVGVAFIHDTHPGIQTRPLCENRLVAVLPEGHPLSALDVLQVSDLLGETFIGFEDDIPVGRLVRSLFQNAGYTLEIKVEVQFTHVAYALVRAGAGIALIDEITASEPGHPGVVVRPITPAVPVQVSLLYPALEPLSLRAQDFIATLESMHAAP